MAKATRKFGGKVYKWYDDYYSHSTAAKAAKSQRKKGKAARIVESGGKFVIYTRG